MRLRLKAHATDLGLHALALGLLFLPADAEQPPVIYPAKPTPRWSWDRIPTSFHGADKERAFNGSEVRRLAKYQVLCLEKWYTPCASAGPAQSGPSCDVEKATLALFAQTKALKACEHPHLLVVLGPLSAEPGELLLVRGL